MTAPRLRLRLWTNRHLLYERDLAKGEVARAVADAERSLAEHDRWVLVLEDVSGVQAPWIVGNDHIFADFLLRTEYGMKLPEGEIGWQRRNGLRVPPEAFLGGTT